MNRQLERRLSQIEASRSGGASPTRILADRPIEEGQAEDAIANWRALVASGEASISGDTLSVIGPEMTEAEWERLHVPSH